MHLHVENYLSIIFKDSIIELTSCNTSSSNRSSNATNSEILLSDFITIKDDISDNTIIAIGAETKETNLIKSNVSIKFEVTMKYEDILDRSKKNRRHMLETNALSIYN